MSDNRVTRSARVNAGLCIDCAGARGGATTKRCEGCREKNRLATRRADARRKSLGQVRDLKEMREIKTGRLVFGDLPSEPRARQDHQDRARFIRAQGPQAVPLLARLYSLPESKINTVRCSPGRVYLSQRMPLRLLEELVIQREQTMHIDHFTVRESSIVECAR